MSTDLEAQRTQESASSAVASPDFEIPQGLRFLLRTTQIRVYRVPIEGENKCCSAFPRKFYVADGEGNPILEGVESSSWCARLCAESSHAFEVDFRDADGITVLSMEKTAACSTFYCCNAPAISVVSGNDNYGTVMQSGILPRTRLSLLDGLGRPQLRLLGPCARQSRYIDGIFKLKCFSERGSLGRLTVQHFAGMDSYQIYFPVDLDLRMKCLLIASAVLLRFFHAYLSIRSTQLACQFSTVRPPARLSAGEEQRFCDKNRYCRGDAAVGAARHKEGKHAYKRICALLCPLFQNVSGGGRRKGGGEAIAAVIA
ncbi:unnamed protein product [Hydatigera taeniaeformis]|uniref:Phospholipid scramblase n=1 Tax=Hydatigena taeniaeformis TaxID=6205 RepID=A0A158REA4_HYDTA|nr:unnamed protein product [Hydatigera taeniaeformis]